MGWLVQGFLDCLAEFGALRNGLRVGSSAQHVAQGFEAIADTIQAFAKLGQVVVFTQVAIALTCFT